MSRTQVWVIDDDADMREETARAVVRCWYPGLVIRFGELQVHRIESLEAAVNEVGAPRLILVDLSALCPPQFGARGYYSAVARLCELHPGAPVLILSQVGRDIAQETADMVKRVSPDSVVRVVPVKKEEVLYSLYDALGKALSDGGGA